MAHILAPRSPKKVSFMCFWPGPIPTYTMGSILIPDYQALGQEALKFLNAILKKEWNGIKFEMKPVCWIVVSLYAQIMKMCAVLYNFGTVSLGVSLTLKRPSIHPKKVKSLLKRPKQKKCNGMEGLFKRSQWQRISKMYKKRRVFGRSTAVDRLLKNKAGNRRKKAWLLYSECSLFTIVNWFLFLALDEGGSSSNIFFYQLVKSYVAKVHTS